MIEEAQMHLFSLWLKRARDSDFDEFLYRFGSG
jgi:hypothetical protein